MKGRISFVAAALLLAATLLAATGPVLAAQQPKVLGKVTALALNVRQGDGVSYSVYGTLEKGAAVEITGVNPKSDWLQIAYKQAPDGKGWVAAYYIEITGGSLSQLPVVKPEAPANASPAAKGSASGGKLVFRVKNGGEIYLVNADGSDLRRLTNGMDPALSPDGSKVAFTRWSEPRGLYIINVDGSGERLLFGVQQARFPAWSRDGSKIAYTFQNGVKPENEECEMREVDGEWEKVCTTYPEDWYWTVATVNVSDAAYKDVPSAQHSYSPTWSPDDKLIAYRGEKGLVKVDLADTSGRLIGLTDDYNDYSPAWSPDGGKLAFAYNQSNQWQIYLVNNDGSARQQLTLSAILGETPNSSTSPAWSPDGQRIAFVSNRRGVWELWTMRADGSEQTPLFDKGMSVAITEVGVDDRVVSWGP